MCGQRVRLSEERKGKEGCHEDAAGKKANKTSGLKGTCSHGNLGFGERNIAFMFYIFIFLIICFNKEIFVNIGMPLMFRRKNKTILL